MCHFRQFWEEDDEEEDDEDDEEGYEDDDDGVCSCNGMRTIYCRLV